MLTIRLRRHGARRDPHYRVVVTERSAKRDGPFIEILGHYHPRKRPAEIVFDMERIETWLGKGAIMSDTVRTLYRKVQTGRLEMPESETPKPGVETAKPESETPKPESEAPKPDEAAAEKADAGAGEPQEATADAADEASASEEPEGPSDTEASTAGEER